MRLPRFFTEALENLDEHIPRLEHAAAFEGRLRPLHLRLRLGVIAFERVPDGEHEMVIELGHRVRASRSMLLLRTAHVLRAQPLIQRNSILALLRCCERAIRQ
jgi:hypothetical protein